MSRSTPQLHRRLIAADPDLPSDDGYGRGAMLVPQGWDSIELRVNYSTDAVTPDAKLQLHWWDETNGRWYHNADDILELDTAANVSKDFPCRGNIAFATASTLAAASSAQLSIFFCLVRKRGFSGS